MLAARAEPDQRRRYLDVSADLALTHIQNGEFVTADIYLESVARLADEIDDGWATAVRDFVTAQRELFVNRPEHALPLARSALEQFASASSPDEADLMWCHEILSDVYLYCRRFEEARAELDRAERYDEARLPYEAAWTRYRRGVLSMFTGEYREARRLLDDAMGHFRATEDRYGVLYAHESLGQLARLRGEFDVAEAELQAALAEAEIAGSRSAVTMHERLGRLGAQARREARQIRALPNVAPADR